MYNILNSLSSVNLYTELATVIRLTVVVFFFLIWHPDVYNCHNSNIQLSPEGEVNRGGYIPRREVYIHRSSPTVRGIVVLVFTKSDGLKNASSLMPTISSSESFAKRRAIFLSVRKTVNIQGYSKLIKANQNARKLLSTDLENAFAFLA